MSTSMYELIGQSFLETLWMVVASAFFSTIIGIPLGIALHVTKKGQIATHVALNQILGIIVNVGRSVPFIILLVAIIPLTRFIIGTSIGTNAAIVPLTIGSIPFLARLVEGALMDVPAGLIEAAQTMGATRGQIIKKVMLPEALPGILNAIIIMLVALVNYSAMAGAIGGGGLGDVGIRYGYQRFEPVVMLVTVVILVLLVQVIQSVGERLVKKVDHR